MFLTNREKRKRNRIAKQVWKDQEILFLEPPRKPGGPYTYGVVGGWYGLAAEKAVKNAIRRVNGKPKR